MKSKNQILLAAMRMTGYSLFAMASSALAALPTFTENLMGNTGQDSQGQTTMVDVDKDGDLDWLMGANGAGIYFFENQGLEAGKVKWAMHKVGANGGCETSGKAMDINGDGYPDHLSGRAWLKNPGASGNIKGTWPSFSTGSSTNCADAIIGDWNHDGRLDVAFVQRNQPSVWYHIPPGNPEGPWTGYVFSGIQTHSGLSAGDFNKDGMLDIIIDNTLFLSKSKAGTAWEQVKMPYALRGNQDGVIVEAGDLDGDGDLDVAHMGHWTNGAVTWQENVDGTGKTWKSNALGSVGDLSHSVNIADIDNDGDQDIQMGADGGASFWYENMGNKTFNRVQFTSRPTHDMRVGDVDGDGDLDMIGKPWGGGAHYFWQSNLADTDASKKKDWKKGPLSSHNPYNPHLASGSTTPVSFFRGGPSLEDGLNGRFLKLPQAGPYSLVLRAMNGTLVSSLSGRAEGVVDLQPLYRNAGPGVYFLGNRAGIRETSALVTIE